MTDTSRDSTVSKGAALDWKGVCISLFFGLTIGFGTGFVGTGFESDRTIVCRFGGMVFEDCDFVDNAFDTE